MDQEHFFSRAARIFVAGPFLFALLTLLLNDGVLKHEYPGWFTGKLSDVAGLFVVAGLAVAAWPRRAELLLLLIAVSFFWWKSPASQWLIDWLNGNGVPIGRVIDLSDLIALPALPLGATLLRPVLRQPRSLVKPVMAAVSGTFVLLALTGTSVLPNTRDFSIRKADPAGQIDIVRAEEIIQGIAKEYRLLHCADCQQGSGVVYQGGKGLFLRYTMLPQNRGIHFRLEGNPGGPFGGGARDIVQSLQKRLELELGSSFPDMELAVDLSPYGERATTRPAGDWP
jgi:hypothetical protein